MSVKVLTDHEYNIKVAPHSHITRYADECKGSNNEWLELLKVHK